MPTVTAMPLTAGADFARFRIEDPLGSGGMAVVYRAYELRLARHVALKVLPASLLHEEAFAQRFEREARIVAQLEHPHIVPIYDFGIDEGVPWMSMRLLAGGTLADNLNGRRFDAAEVAAVLAPVAAALDHAHAHDIVHRDVKPTNVMRDGFGNYYLTDFGIARMAAAPTQLTMTGVMTGTPFYMSPEQVLGGIVDRRSDIYALGIVAYEMLTGRVPFTGDTPMAVLMQHARDPLPSAENAGLPRDLYEVLSVCLAKDPAARFASAGGFVAALRAGRVSAEAVAAAGVMAPAATRRLTALGAPPATAVAAAHDAATIAMATPSTPRGATWRGFAVALAAVIVVFASWFAVARRPAGAGAAQPDPAIAPSASSSSTSVVPTAAPAVEKTSAAVVGGDTAPAPASRPLTSEPLRSERPAATDGTTTARSARATASSPAPVHGSGAQGAGEPALELRHNGSYRIGPNQDGRFTHFVFRSDGTCVVRSVRFASLQLRAVDNSAGPGCSYAVAGQTAAIEITRADGNVEHAMAFAAADGSVTVRRQPALFVPFATR